MERKFLNRYASVIFLLISLVFNSCSSEVNIEMDYGFSVTMQKYRQEISNGETKELEFFINRAESYMGTRYFASVFLRTGDGIFSDGKNVLEENNFFEVSSSGFKLYYTSTSSDTHKIEVIIKDSFGKEKETIISLTNK